MATNYVQDGVVLNLTAPHIVASGAPALVGSLFGVAVDAIANGATGEFVTEGVFTINKDTNLVISAGDRVFWDVTNKWVDKTVTAQTCVGVATTSAVLAGTTVEVKLLGSTPAGT